MRATIASCTHTRQQSRMARSPLPVDIQMGWVTCQVDRLVNWVTCEIDRWVTCAEREREREMVTEPQERLRLVGRSRELPEGHVTYP